MVSFRAADRRAWAQPEVETVLPGVHRAPVPMPHDGLRAISVYVIEDHDGVTLVDAGWDSEVSRAAVDAGLAAAGAGVGDITRILVTHVHYDHIGQAHALEQAGAGGYWLGAQEESHFVAAGLAGDDGFEGRMVELERHGGHEIAEIARANRTPIRFDWGVPERWAVEGDTHPTRAAGTLEAIHTPGHTRGHLCFLAGERRLLFSGDHVLPHITPSLGVEDVPNYGALSLFLSSLAKVRNLDVDLVLPAHGPVFDDLADRVDDLIGHHERRLSASEAAVAPSGGPMTSKDVATHIGWTRRETAFDDLDTFNRAMAITETAIHLELLAAQGRVTKHVADDGGVTWTRSS